MDSNSLTQAVPAVESAGAAPARRRRADRYRTHEPAENTSLAGEEEKRYTEQPVLQADSETAREVAKRFQMEERDGSTADAQRAVRGASSRAGMTAASRNPGARPAGAGRISGFPYGRNASERGGEQTGYAPGRMGFENADRGRMSQESRTRLAQESRNAAGGAGESREPAARPGGNRIPDRYGASGTADAGRMAAKDVRAREGERPFRRSGVPVALTVLLLIIGACILGILLIPEDADGLPGMLKGTVTGLLNGQKESAGRVTIFSVEDEKRAAPADVLFTVVTEGKVADVRLVDEDGAEIPTVRTGEESTAASLWELTWHLDESWEGTVRLQTLLGEEWRDTDQTAEIQITPKALEKAETGAVPDAVEFTDTAAQSTGTETETEKAGTRTEQAEIGSEATASFAMTEDGPSAEAENGSNSAEGTAGTEDKESASEENPEDLVEWVEDDEDPETAPAAEDGDGSEGRSAENAGASSETDEDDPEGRSAENAGASSETDEDDPEGRGAENAGASSETDEDDPEGRGAENAGASSETDEDDPEPQGTENAGASPEPDGQDPERAAAEPAATSAAANEAAEPEKPKLTVAAAESADPALITTTQIYNGTKKVNEYARASADQLQMPTLGEYTRQKMGILTFRTDAFRQNASIGTVEGLNSLELAWTAEAGSAKGASGTMYYGVGWVGQPIIVKWSKEVREKSEIYDSKREKTGLREVIVAGLDGRIYFLDLTDGKATRNSIKLGYPMKGTPSVSPTGAPYMTVGQFARKMARGTGTIGLRQYNLYSMKEMALIDGLDAKNNRPFNQVGSFETSALIDRKSGSMVTAGTNGLLYVIKLNSEFDYQAGVYQQSPTQVLLRSKAKGEKDASTAVEASVAMYDRYVYYADMGGYLRCVDTNTMTVAWAAALGDSVESTPALDWHGEEGLDLYAATELSLRKKGEAEVKCFDALSGEERWSTAVGVQKDSKGKNVSGFRASPVVGQNGLSDYVYYTVNNLNDVGREALNLGGNSSAAVFALRKEDGSVVWSYGLSGRGYSSPVAVYDGNGNGAIIQCAGDGSIVMLDGITGIKKSEYKLDGAIEASPAVYNNMMVIATTEKNKNNIYGIRIQ